MEYKKIKEINEYKSESINPMKTPDTMYELYSVPFFTTGHPEYLHGSEIGSSKVIVQKNDMQMNTTRIKNYLIRGARRDQGRIYPNREWGYGEVDLYETFLGIR